MSTPMIYRKVRTLESDRERLEREVVELRAEQNRLMERGLGLEEQNCTLTTLYVACQRLHSTLDRAEVLLILREIVANLIGCEEYVLFSVTRDGWLHCVDSFGIGLEAFESFAPGAGLIGRAVASGKPYLAEESDGADATRDEANLTACIPLRLNGVINGAVALFRLLPQKSGLLELDRELFRLIETHLPMALYCSELHQGVKGKNGVVA